MSVAEAAEAPGIKPETPSDLLNGHIGITPEMAIRLSAASDTTAESRMNQQAQYDLWQAEQRMSKLGVRKLFPAPVDAVILNF
ncbi:HigA family addiction module antitoxin [Desulfobacterales bacterium HSG2]|nr:HigA family addiction module antitoxin [Desulfobacterales bacterium HSG2]